MKPRFYPGDRIYVQNYKKRPPVWEPGEVVASEVNWRSPDKSRVSYRVMLDRQAPSGKYLFLYVGSDGVKDR